MSFMDRYKLDNSYNKFLTKSIICFSLLPVSYFLYILWIPFCKIEVLKNYFIEMLGKLLGFIIVTSILILSICAIAYAISLIVKTIKQTKKESSKKLLKAPKFIFASVLMPIAIFFSVYFFFNVYDILNFFCFSYF